MRTFSVLCCLIVVYIAVANAAKQTAGTADDASDDTAGSPTTTTTEATTTTTEAEATTTTTTQATTTTTQSSDTCQACDQNVVVIDLETNGGNLSSAVTGSVDGITVTSYTDPSVADPCDARALVEVDFQHVYCEDFCFTGCIRGTNCSQRVLRVDLEYNDISSGWLFNIGDSATNNGYGGDGSTQQNDAELQCLNGDVALYTNDKCSSTAIDTLTDGCNTTSVSTSTIHVSNDQLRYGTNTGESFTRCRPDCLYALNGQSDNQGTVNERVFVALNRVVSNSARYGYGVCRATLRWVCPDC